MKQSKLDVAQLMKQDPVAWTALLRSERGMEDIVVTAVTAEPLYISPHSSYNHRVTCYALTLAGHSDPISLIGKRTNRSETLFYRNVAPQIPRLAPYCWFTHVIGNEGWIILNDVPNHFPPEKWLPDDVEAAINNVTALHAPFWNQTEQVLDCGLPHLIGQEKYTWQELREEQAIYFEQGPASIISEHAINNAGQLAPVLLKAANGLAVMRGLDGWPGVLGESHLTAVADLLDDPVPMLEPLRHLPATLLHGDLHTHHWRLTLFDDHRLIDWRKAVIGPGVCDLVSFLEQIDLLHEGNTPLPIRVRQERPSTEETIVDSYMLGMSARLGAQFDARAARQAIPAARCLYVLTNWFPHFAGWFSQMPNKYTWQKVNRMSDEQLVGTTFQSIVGYRPYLAAVFQRFLHAYRTL